MSSDRRKRILFMEDSDIFADLLSGIFDSSKYIVERAENGFEGIKKVYSFMPHLIITDIEMPVFKGYQVTRLLKSRKNTKSIPVIMFTTLDESKDIFWGTHAGADAFIVKSPENFQPLLDTVDNLIESSEKIDFTALERESKKINDNTIIEIVNNLFDNKLFQTTIIGLLTEISGKVHSMEAVVSGIFDLLKTVCQAEIASLMICGTNRTLYAYTANFSGFTNEIVDNFYRICNADFNNIFNGYKFSSKITKSFNPDGNNKNKITSYISIPLIIAGEKFASIHIANAINDYFSPFIMENINVFIGSASPVIANALSMHELHELQKNTRTAFARYVPADVMDEIITDTAKKASVSESRNITVLFSDIRSFTEISEHSDAQSVVDFLNDYFSKMGSEIISEGGHIDKFIGDAIMAVFGAFQTSEHSPLNAVKAALKMLTAMETINSGGNLPLSHKINIGIGINCGSCILGNIGFQNKMDYTIIGDTVNLASRIENLTKTYCHPLIVSEYVYNETKDKFLFRKVDNVRVKGKNKHVGIYAVYSGFHGTDGNKLRSGDFSDIAIIPSLLINRETLVNYNKGLQVFYIREWKLAGEYFAKALEHDSEDFLSKLYLERSRRFEDNPPPDDWDTVITFSEK